MVLDLWRLLEWAWDPGKAMRWWVSNCGYNSDMEPPDWLTGAGAGDEGEDAPEPESRSRGSSSCMNTSSSSTSLLSWPTAEPGGVTGEERPGEQRWWLNILSSMNESINKILYIFCTLLNRNYLVRAAYHYDDYERACRAYGDKLQYVLYSPEEAACQW